MVYLTRGDNESRATKIFNAGSAADFCWRRSWSRNRKRRVLRCILKIKPTKFEAEYDSRTIKIVGSTKQKRKNEPITTLIASPVIGWLFHCCLRYSRSHWIIDLWIVNGIGRKNNDSTSRCQFRFSPCRQKALLQPQSPL